jgi:hypothetical protein
MGTIDFRADHRLSDTLALQIFVLRNQILRRGLILIIAMSLGLVIATLSNGAPLSDALADLGNNVGRYLAIAVAGLVVIHIVILAMGVLAWRRLVKPRQIRAVLTAEGITMQKDGFSYGARWADADFLTEDRAAFLMKFSQLYMRLPKRGFAPGDEAQFRALASMAVPKTAYRLKPAEA